MSKRSLLAAVILGLALVPLPTAVASAAACVWQKTTWGLPTGATAGRVDGYDGSRYAVGATGRLGQFGSIVDARGTLWDNGTIVLQIPGETPHVRDVNAAGLIVGDDIVNDSFVAVTIGRDGRSTVLPGNPAWDGYSAWLVNNAGDIVGSASIGLTHKVVVWPASAPGTYRELPTPNVDTLFLTDVDAQGRIIAQTSSGDGGGFVWDTDGQWRVLAAQGTGDYGTPWAIRDGRVVGGLSNGPFAAEWNARGGLVRTIGGGALSGRAIGGNGTIGGYAFVGSLQRVVLWRNGTVDPLSAVSDMFRIVGISDDENTLVGTEGSRPAHYRCA